MAKSFEEMSDTELESSNADLSSQRFKIKQELQQIQEILTRRARETEIRELEQKLDALRAGGK